MASDTAIFPTSMKGWLRWNGVYLALAEICDLKTLGNEPAHLCHANDVTARFRCPASPWRATGEISAPPPGSTKQGLPFRGLAHHGVEAARQQFGFDVVGCRNGCTVIVGFSDPRHLGREDRERAAFMDRCSRCATESPTPMASTAPRHPIHKYVQEESGRKIPGLADQHRRACPEESEANRISDGDAHLHGSSSQERVSANRPSA